MQLDDEVGRVASSVPAVICILSVLCSLGGPHLGLCAEVVCLLNSGHKCYVGTGRTGPA